MKISAKYDIRVTLRQTLDDYIIFYGVSKVATTQMAFYFGILDLKVCGEERMLFLNFFLSLIRWGDRRCGSLWMVFDLKT